MCKIKVSAAKWNMKESHKLIMGIYCLVRFSRVRSVFGILQCTLPRCLQPTPKSRLSRLTRMRSATGGNRKQKVPTIHYLFTIHLPRNTT